MGGRGERLAGAENTGACETGQGWAWGGAMRARAHRGNGREHERLLVGRARGAAGRNGSATRAGRAGSGSGRERRSAGGRRARNGRRAQQRSGGKRRGLGRDDETDQDRTAAWRRQRDGGMEPAIWAVGGCRGRVVLRRPGAVVRQLDQFRAVDAAKFDPGIGGAGQRIGDGRRQHPPEQREQDQHRIAAMEVLPDESEGGPMHARVGFVAPGRAGRIGGMADQTPEYEQEIQWRQFFGGRPPARGRGTRPRCVGRRVSLRPAAAPRPTEWPRRSARTGWSR